MRLPIQYFIIVYFNLGNWLWDSSFHYRRGPHLRGDDWVSEGESAYIFAVKGTFIQFLHGLDVFDIDNAEGLFPWKAEVILSNTGQE